MPRHPYPKQTALLAPLLLGCACLDTVPTMAADIGIVCLLDEQPREPREFSPWEADGPRSMKRGAVCTPWSIST